MALALGVLPVLVGIEPLTRELGAAGVLPLAAAVLLLGAAVGALIGGRVDLRA